MSSPQDLDNLFPDPLGSGVESPNFDDTPDFGSLFEEESGSDNELGTENRFKTYENLVETPKPYFKNPNYYKILLHNEGDISKRVHENLGGFLKSQDTQEKSAFRSRFISAFWEFCGTLASKTGPSLPVPKKLALRFGIILPTAVTPEQRKMISEIPEKNGSGEPVYYVDEWIRAVSLNQVSASATDETKGPKNSAAKINAALERTAGRYEANMQVAKNLSNELAGFEAELKSVVSELCSRDASHEFDGVFTGYSESQRSLFNQISTLLRSMSNTSRKLDLSIRELGEIKQQLDLAQDAGQEIPEAVDTKASVEEMKTVRQMAKLCVGRQGNHFPMLMSNYFRGSIRDMGTREVVINAMAKVESLDPQLFHRTFKQQTNRIVPNVILVPCYGDAGVCWEPFEKMNRATSRGRVIIPMYPKNIETAVTMAMGDLRWQVAKEKAQHYWMEEGLTGWYYQWFSDKKMKGDVKDAFVQDYVLWITKESEGTQKLDKEVRALFWRLIPFPQEVKENLKNRGFIYSELYKKDINRSMSDGY